MSRTRLILAPVVAVLVAWLSTSLYSADLAGAATPLELGSRFSQAMANKDATAFSLLVYWDRVLPQDRKSLLAGFVEEAKNTASGLRFLTPAEMDQEMLKVGGTPPVRKPVMRGGVSLDFNLPVAGYLVYRSTNPAGQRQGSAVMPVGVIGGRYFFVTRAPVS